MIDPRIALDVAPTQGFGPDWNSVNQTRQTTQQIQTAQAALPGIQAESAMLQRENQGEQWVQDHAHEYVKTDENGFQAFDYNKAAVGVANAGFTKTATGLLAHYIENDLRQTQTATQKYELVKNISDGIVATLGTMPPGETRNAFVKQASDNLDTLGYLPNSGEKLGTNTFARYYARNPKTGQPIIDSNGNPALDEQAIQGARMSTVPVETQERIRENRLMNHTTQESMDPNSDVSKSTNQIAVDLKLAKPGDPPKSDFYWNNYRPDFALALKHSQPDKDYLDAVRTGSLKHGADSITIKSAIDAGNEINAPNLWRPFQTMSAFLENISNDPKYAAYVSRLHQAIMLDSTIDPTKQSPDAVMAKLQANLGYNTEMRDYYDSKSRPETVGGPVGGGAVGNVAPQVGVAPNQPAQKQTSGPATELPPQTQPTGSTFQPTNKSEEQKDIQNGKRLIADYPNNPVVRKRVNDALKAKYHREFSL